MKSKLCFDDVIDIAHNVLRYSGFVAKKMFRHVKTTPSVDSRYQAGSWHEAPVTLEEIRIARFLKTLDLSNKKILHVGTGSCSIAKQFHQKCAQIDGITVMDDEIAYADNLKDPKFQSVFDRQIQ